MSVVENTASLQRTRLYRVATVFVAVFIHMVLCWTIWSVGLMSVDFSTMVLLSAVVALGYLFLALMVWFELNLVFEDPDLSVPIVLWSLLAVVATANLSTELKPLVLFAGTALIIVTTNRLSRTQQLIVGCIGILGYLGSALYLSDVDNLGWITELVLLLAFGLVLFMGPLLYQFERDNFENSITDKNQQLSQALDRIKDLAVRDELTGVFNRRHLMEVLSHEKAMADRKNYSFSICYVDLDHFKKVNDKFGHAAGDHVLRSFARCCEDVLREIDCVARMGGEEFLLVVASASQAETFTAAGRLAERMKELDVTESDAGYRITASMGIAEYRQDDSIQKLLDRADRALYEAKRTGRNRIVVAGADASSLSPSGSGSP